MLRDAYDDSVSAGATLEETLRTKERAARALVSGGSLASISRNGASHSNAFGPGNITTADLAEAWEELLTLFEVIFADGTYTTDADIKAEMLRRLVPCNEFTKDFTGLHCA